MVVSDEEQVRRVESVIKQYGLDAEVIWHRDEPVLSLEDAMKVHNLSPSNVLKCLLLKSRDGKVVAVMASGEVRIDIKSIERKFNLRKLSFMSSNEMRSRFNVEPGGIDPLTLPDIADMIFAEKRLLDKDFVIGSAGSKYCGLKIKPTELMKLLDAVIF